MKIYPDPELPDVLVEWSEPDCRANTPTVAVTLTGLDNPASTSTINVACTDVKVTIADVARERYHVDGALLDQTGSVVIEADGGDVDLRNGFNADTGLFFDAFSNFHVAWTFASGSCESLGAVGVNIVLSTAQEPEFDVYPVPCLFPMFSTQLPAGTYTLALRAVTQNEDVVATSPETAPFVVTGDGYTDIGTLVLAP